MWILWTCVLWYFVYIFNSSILFVFWDTRRWIKSKSTIRSKLTHHRQNPTETKYMFATINTRWEATQRVMAAKLTRLTHKIVIQLHLVAESCTICISRSSRPVRILLDTSSYQKYSVPQPQTGGRNNQWTERIQTMDAFGRGNMRNATVSRADERGSYRYEWMGLWVAFLLRMTIWRAHKTGAPPAPVDMKPVFHFSALYLVQLFKLQNLNKV
jgi:hypothetical protein